MVTGICTEGMRGGNAQSIARRRLPRVRAAREDVCELRHEQAVTLSLSWICSSSAMSAPVLQATTTTILQAIGGRAALVCSEEGLSLRRPTVRTRTRRARTRSAAEASWEPGRSPRVQFAATRKRERSQLESRPARRAGAEKSWRGAFLRGLPLPAERPGGGLCCHIHSTAVCHCRRVLTQLPLRFAAGNITLR